MAKRKKHQTERVLEPLVKPGKPIREAPTKGAGQTPGLSTAGWAEAGILDMVSEKTSEPIEKVPDTCITASRRPKLSLPYSSIKPDPVNNPG